MYRICVLCGEAELQPYPSPSGAGHELGVVQCAKCGYVGMPLAFADRAGAVHAGLVGFGRMRNAVWGLQQGGKFVVVPGQGISGQRAERKASPGAALGITFGLMLVVLGVAGLFLGARGAPCTDPAYCDVGAGPDRGIQYFAYGLMGVGVLIFVLGVRGLRRPARVRSAP